MLFIEGIRRPQAFMHAAGRALAMGKPILAIKTGATAKSQAASLSHTGAIAGDYAAYLAMCERYGIVNCRSLDDLVETALAFDGGRLPKGPRISFVTTSGGTVDLLHDYAAAEGAAMPDFTDATKAALKPLMQDGIAPSNPLDVGIPSTLKVAAELCETAARDPNIDMVAWGSPMPRKIDAWGDVTPLRQLLARTDKPIVGFGRMIYQVERRSRRRAEGGGLPVPAGHRADHPRAQRPVVPRRAGGPRCRRRRRRRPASELSPATLEATLARYGIALPKSQAVASAAEAVAAAERIGFPVALKIRSPDILHKTEAGGVALDLRTRDGGANGGGRARCRGSRGASACAHRRLPGAGDGRGRRGDRRRPQRSALWADAAGRLRRRAGRARQGRGVAAAAGDGRARSAAWSRA